MLSQVFVCPWGKSASRGVAPPRMDAPSIIMKLWEDNAFTGICLSMGEECIQRGCTPQDGCTFHNRCTSLRMDTPHPHPEDRWSTIGWYASYWNADLLKVVGLIFHSLGPIRRSHNEVSHL